MNGSFVFYESFLDAVELLPEDQQLEALLSIARYALRAQEPAVPNIILTIAKPIIDANKNRRFNGQKGGRPSQKTDGLENEKPKVSEKKTDGSETEKPNVNVNVNVNANKNVNKYHSSDFEAVWKLYPRKEGRKQAEAAFQRAIRDGDTVEEIKAGILRYKAHIQATNTEARYIKQGSTFFNGRCWKDEYSTDKGYLERADDDMDWALMDL